MVLQLRLFACIPMVLVMLQMKIPVTLRAMTTVKKVFVLVRRWAWVFGVRDGRVVIFC